MPGCRSAVLLCNETPPTLSPAGRREQTNTQTKANKRSEMLSGRTKLALINSAIQREMVCDVTSSDLRVAGSHGDRMEMCSKDHNLETGSQKFVVV